MATINNSRLPAMVQWPDYDRQRLKSRIVHLGFAAFHRAHQGIFANRLLNQGIEQDWGLCEVNLFAGEEKFRRAVEAAYLQLMHNGAKATVEELCNLS